MTIVNTVAAAVLARRIKDRRLPSLTPPQTGQDELDRSLAQITEHLRMYEGDKGAPTQRFVTLEDLEGSGLINTVTRQGFASISKVLGGNVPQAISTVPRTRVVYTNAPPTSAVPPPPITGGSGGVDALSSRLPQDNEVAVWADGSTIEGDPNFTWDGTSLKVINGANSIVLDAGNVFADHALWLNQDTAANTNYALSGSSGGSTYLNSESTVYIMQNNVTQALWNGTHALYQVPIKIKEAANAVSDTPGYGQIWIKNTTPNELWFTDDAGTDVQLGTGGGGGLNDLVDDLTPQLGGDLGSNTFDILMADNDAVYFGTGNDASIAFNATNLIITATGAANNIYLNVNATENGIWIAPNGAVYLYDNNIESFKTQQFNATGNTSGARVKDGAGTYMDVGYNELPSFNFNASDTLEKRHAGHATGKTNTSAYTLTGPTSSDVDFKVNAVCTVFNLGASANYTLSDTTTCTMYYCDGAAAPVDIVGSGTLAPGGVISLWRYSTTAIYIFGSGFTV